jgi:poly-gamma-glutamate synthesis protein (capsule biosynthesis protein)
MSRRKFLRDAVLLFLGSPALRAQPSPPSDRVTLFLCGDVMTGRGIDQALPHPSDPRIYEPYMKSALGYVRLAEAANGPIPRPVDFSYIWGDALEELARMGPDVRIINLETSVTTSNDRMPKGINYRMNPRNVPCLTAAKIDCCALANNHILDWGEAGLLETVETLQRVGVKTGGAGRDLAAAEAPAVLDLSGGRRVLVFSFGSVTSGVSRQWAASENRPGMNLLGDFSDETVERIAGKIRAVRRPRDIVVASIHWGSNWGYGIPDEQTLFAHKLVDDAGVDIIHGHSSHHVKGIEVYKEKPILYGCGDFLNDYEGIEGYEEFRADLVLMYFLSMDASLGRVLSLDMTPLQIRRFRLNRASRKDARWLRDTLNRQGSRLGTRVELEREGTLKLGWGQENNSGTGTELRN